MCVFVCVGGEGKERSTRVERLLSASLACGRPAAMQALAYWSLPSRSPLQVVCVSYIRLCTLQKCKGHFNPRWITSVASVQSPCIRVISTLPGYSQLRMFL